MGPLFKICVVNLQTIKIMDPTVDGLQPKNQVNQKIYEHTGGHQI